jgi:CheY-like chemotaxis protein
MGLMADISERKRMEEQLRQAAKMEAVGRLAGGVAHDFNNLLTVITGYSDILLQRLGLGDALRRQVEEIKKAGERAAGLTSQLLAFSRKQVAQPKAVDLNEAVAGLASMLRRLIGEHIDLVTTLQEGIGRIRVDPGQLDQILMNLAVNARDAMPNGGALTIETRTVCGDRPMIRLIVRDTGHGMDADTVAHIFEPFFTTKEQGKGTGLGLATTYGIVTQSGGAIRVDSAPGRGTVFTIEFPLIADPLQAAALPSPECAPAAREGTILLVEDEALVRELVREILAGDGYHVLEASGGEEAVQRYGQQIGRIDLLVTDVVMPGMSGRVLAERVRLLRPDLKVLFMSGYTDDAVLRDEARGATVAFLQKPFAPDVLSTTVRQILDEVRARRI